jgi:hypothetical protein
MKVEAKDGVRHENETGTAQCGPPFALTRQPGPNCSKSAQPPSDRKLKAAKQLFALRGKNGTKQGTLLRSQIPMRTHFPFDERQPGFFEADMVHNRGDHDTGGFNLTLTATDVYSGWVEPRTLLNKAYKWWTLEVFSVIADTLPFPLRGIDTDNGGEFINKDMIAWRQARDIQFTRSRLYKKNDNCHVEQKNNQCVRNYVGYYRFDTPAERDALAAVYRVLCPLLNYFLPTIKLMNKTRVSVKVRKVSHQPSTVRIYDEASPLPHNIFYVLSLSFNGRAEDVALKTFEQICAKYLLQSRKTALLQTTLEILDLIEDNINWSRVILSEQWDIHFQRKMFSLIPKKEIMMLKNDEQIDDVTKGYSITFALNGSIALVQHWIKSGMNIPQKKLAHILLKLNRQN